MLLTHPDGTTVAPEDFKEGRRLHLYHRGEQIPLDQQGIWQVYRGTVELSTTQPGGEEVLLGWVQPASFFGMWLSHLDVYAARSLSDVYLRWFFLSEIESSPHLASQLVGSLARRLRQTEAMLAIAGQRRVEDRLCNLLSLLKDEMGHATEDGIRIELRFTHQTIANAIGTTRVTVTRLLGKLQRQGCITLDSERHIIVNRTNWLACS
ncbi:MAG: Crp/Fnr family transcriptional regulator [Spirulinaceae cyanobacterium SM2_1_0]|nr:Crp/Fnr family transcriptional regulator [Spirulinaceae cyanobacterium SM2_1_0]